MNGIKFYPGVKDLRGCKTTGEAIVQSGLNWDAHFEPIQTASGVTVPDKKAVVKADGTPLGIVGDTYHIFQNQEMWNFIEAFRQTYPSTTFHASGELRQGKKVWVALKNGETEVLNGDPYTEYFLFVNSFDGTYNVRILFTPVRIVCNNMINAAVSQGSNYFSLRHTHTIDERIKDVKIALQVKTRYLDALYTNLKYLSKKELKEKEMKEILETRIFDVNDKLKERAKKTRQEKVQKVLELVETGKGSDIPGVRGTAYGLYQAITEWCDHYQKTRQGKVNQSLEEKEFERITFRSENFKTKALYSLLEAA